ncbi:MAG: hypothetical protein CBCREVIR_2953 [Candidatus Burkholderia crenata]|nr:MAG: hypothetical protein CBCREVIR_2953 [Candidatus Burkholderia crenata]
MPPSDAAARESDGENEADDDAGSAVNRKKEAAARRVSSAGASKAAAGGAGTSSTAPQTAKKNVQKSAVGSLSLSRDQPKGSSSAVVWPCYRLYCPRRKLVPTFHRIPVTGVTSLGSSSHCNLNDGVAMTA